MVSPVSSLFPLQELTNWQQHVTFCIYLILSFSEVSLLQPLRQLARASPKLEQP